MRRLVIAKDVNDSYFDSLRHSLLAPGSADFMVVDLKNDGRQERTTSRLSLFAYLLSRPKRVKAAVFVATRGDTGRTCLGIVPVAELVQVLGFLAPVVRPDDWLMDHAVLLGPGARGRRGELIALLSPSRRCERFVDRRALLEELAKSSVDPAKH